MKSAHPPARSFVDTIPVGAYRRKRSSNALAVTLGSQRGAALVEFALVSIILFMFVIGIMEIGRVLFYWNAATEATRLGARIAVVCTPDSTTKSRINDKINAFLSSIPDKQVDVDVQYLPNLCDADSCETVTVSIKPGHSISTFIPSVALELILPPLTTTLSRESMQSTVQGVANPMCQ